MTTTREDARRERSRTSRHGPAAQLLIAWSPLSLILLAYAAADWIAQPIAAGESSSNRLGFTLNVAAPARADELLFGAVPSVWLQDRLVDGSPQWYDAAATLVYLTHFVTIPLVTAIAWFALRDRFGSWLVAVLSFTVIGVGGYVVYPAAPPWLASDQGVIGTVHRLSGLGSEYPHLGPLHMVLTSGQAGSNPVAAMPSLHAGGALLAGLFLWPVVNRLLRVVLLAYVFAMGVTLVYTGEHYVIDVLAGWATAATAVALGALVGSGHQLESPSPSQPLRRRMTSSSSF